MNSILDRKADWFLPVTPYDYQWDCYEKTVEHIRASTEPAYIYASVSAGKTIMMAMIAKRAQQISADTGRQQLRILSIARTGELVEQNSDEMWTVGRDGTGAVRNSIFSASVGLKKTKYPVIVGSEGTVCRSLFSEGIAGKEDEDHTLRDKVFDLVLVDECHQCSYDDPESQYMRIFAELYRRNPKLRIIGYTGSPFRGIEPIKGKFWEKEIFKIDMWQLVEMGFVHAPVFGTGHDDDLQYDFSSVEPSGIDGTADLTKEQLDEMQKIALENEDLTKTIIDEVIKLTANRNVVLITCAGSKHMKEVARFLPENSYAMITESTKHKQRKIIKEGCDTGKIKYVLQIGCWTVGVNIPSIDTIVILRKIGSLTLLIQLIGRAIRLLKQKHVDLGMTKTDALVLDYSSTMESIGHLFNDPILERAQLEKAKRKDEIILCPRCECENSKFARRCINRTGDKLDKDGRCGFFWSSKICEKCGTENDKVARSCRECDHVLVDPNANLSGKHYTDDDWQVVVRGTIRLSKDRKKIVAEYQLENGDVAKEILDPMSREAWVKAKWAKFFGDHCPRQYGITRGINVRTPILSLVSHLAMFDIPAKITHRKNDKGFSIIAKKSFRSGREVED